MYITEWNFSLSSRNYLNDSCYRAVYLAWVAAALSGLADVLAVWVASDWISSYYDTISIANGGNGILTKNRIPKRYATPWNFSDAWEISSFTAANTERLHWATTAICIFFAIAFVTERYRTETEEERKMRRPYSEPFAMAL